MRVRGAEPWRCGCRTGLTTIRVGPGAQRRWSGSAAQGSGCSPKDTAPSAGLSARRGCAGYHLVDGLQPDIEVVVVDDEGRHQVDHIGLLATQRAHKSTVGGKGAARGCGARLELDDTDGAEGAHIFDVVALTQRLQGLFEPGLEHLHALAVIFSGKNLEAGVGSGASEGIAHIGWSVLQARIWAVSKNASKISSDATAHARGRAPPLRALPRVTTSGTTALFSIAKGAPVRKKPVAISSKIKKSLRSSQAARMRFRTLRRESACRLRLVPVST